MSSNIPPSHVQIKRAYETPAQDDGTRILIDRLWPRGVKKEVLALDQWDKELAPSTELRQWFNHEPERWAEFQVRYAEELLAHAPALDALRALAHKSRITLVYGAHDEIHNNAMALRAMLLAPATH